MMEIHLSCSNNHFPYIKMKKRSKTRTIFFVLFSKEGIYFLFDSFSLVRLFIQSKLDVGGFVLYLFVRLFLCFTYKYVYAIGVCVVVVYAGKCWFNTVGLAIKSPIYRTVYHIIQSFSLRWVEMLSFLSRIKNVPYIYTDADAATMMIKSNVWMWMRDLKWYAESRGRAERKEVKGIRRVWVTNI